MRKADKLLKDIEWDAIKNDYMQCTFHAWPPYWSTWRSQDSTCPQCRDDFFKNKEKK